MIPTFVVRFLKYGNIPRQAVAAYISNCVTCALKGMQLKKAPLKPIISSGFLQRLQVAFRMTCGSAGFEFHNKLSYLSNVIKYSENFEVENLKEMFLHSKTMLFRSTF